MKRGKGWFLYCYLFVKFLQEYKFLRVKLLFLKNVTIICITVGRAWHIDKWWRVSFFHVYTDKARKIETKIIKWTDIYSHKILVTDDVYELPNNSTMVVFKSQNIMVLFHQVSVYLEVVWHFYSFISRHFNLNTSLHYHKECACTRISIVKYRLASFIPHYTYSLVYAV